MKTVEVELTCDVCLDLIPLVHDGVASEASQNAVLQHTQTCIECKNALGDMQAKKNYIIDDKKTIGAIKRGVYGSMCALLVFGALFGVALSNSMGMFYNFLLMPLVGALGYAVLGKKWKIVPFGVFGASYVWLVVQSILDGMFENNFALWVLAAPLYLAFLYSAFVLLGVAIAALLKYAFGREKCDEKENI